jgi:hypothetical protein
LHGCHLRVASEEIDAPEGTGPIQGEGLVPLSRGGSMSSRRRRAPQPRPRATARANSPPPPASRTPSTGHSTRPLSGHRRRRPHEAGQPPVGRRGTSRRTRPRGPTGRRCRRTPGSTPRSRLERAGWRCSSSSRPWPQRIGTRDDRRPRTRSRSRARRGIRRRRRPRRSGEDCGPLRLPMFFSRPLTTPWSLTSRSHEA